MLAVCLTLLFTPGLFSSPDRPTPPDAFVNFESTAVHPVRVSADGEWLYAVNTADARVSVFSLADPARPALEREIRVGLEPVSVTEHPETGELWVANLLSDSVSVVDPRTGRQLATLRVEDEPSDVAFAAGRAFVSCATVDRVLVFDADTRARLDTIEIPAKDPRALAVSPQGDRVYVLSRRSGNGTTILAEAEAPAPPPPTNPELPPAPQTGLIVRAEDPEYAQHFSFTLPDHDVFELDPTSLTIRTSWSKVGTTLYDLAVGRGGEVFVVGTEARNLVRFEPELRGHAVDHRLARLQDGGEVQALDLNAGLDYDRLPNPEAKARALAEPTAIVLAGEYAWLAAHGSDAVAKVRLADGSTVLRADLTPSLGGAASTRCMRGPRGLALHPGGAYLYVHQRLSSSLATLRTADAHLTSEVELGAIDPVPNAVRVGRKFLYDARLSGNGTMSCAVCHVDGDTDGLAWDLGDPGGELSEIPLEFQQGVQPGFPPPGFPSLHPMKGPLVTQPLRDLEQRMHWRGDRGGFVEFNATFDTLMGGSLLADEDMDLFAAWVETAVYAPNPNQSLDRSLKTEGGPVSQQSGFDLFTQAVGLTNACVDCHALGSGSNGLVRDTPQGSNQPMRIAPLRDFYRKTGYRGTSTEALKAGFGRFHNGEVGDLSDLPLGDTEQESRALTAFLMAWDTGAPPILGFQVARTPENLGSTRVRAELDLMESRALIGEVDLVVFGLWEGEEVSLLFDPENASYQLAQAGQPALRRIDLERWTRHHRVVWNFLAVPAGTGVRVALDRDLDGVWDGDES